MRCVSVAVALTLGFSVPVFGATLTVGLDRKGAAGGAAYADIQSAIDAANNGDSVLVRPGEYVIAEPISFRGKKIMVKAEAGAQVTTIRMSEIPKDPRWASVVVFSAADGSSSALHGFTLTSGKGSKWESESSDSRGGGVLCLPGSAPAVTSCVISGNSARCGGGVGCHGNSSATLTDCTISGNSAWEGGGVYCFENCSPTLTNCTVSGNSATGISPGRGGGLCCYGDSSVALANCSISGNSADWGSGVYCAGNSSPTLTSCRISGNSAEQGRGGDYGTTHAVFCDSDSSPTLRDCTISGNAGGGLSCAFATPTLTGCTISGNAGEGVSCTRSSPTLTNCTISGNWTDAPGGGLRCYSSSPLLTKCTISGNWAEYAGGVYCVENSSPTLTSCIVWDNAGGSFLLEGDAQPNVSFSCLETDTVWPGNGNTNADPLFCGWGGKREVWVDPSRPGPGDGSQGNPFSDTRDATTGYSLSLSTGSPCLGTGKDGADMGADNGRCAGPRGSDRMVHLAQGTYAAEDIDLLHKVSLLGAGEDTTVIEGTVVGLRSGSSLAHLAVTKGTRGGILVSAGERPQITNCTISENSAFYGGGVCCWGDSSPSITGCTISGNRAMYGGGAYCSGDSTLTSCRISGNSGEFHGGGVYCSGGSPIVTNCTFSGNSAGLYGGGVFCYDSSPALTSCTISGNSAMRGGGVDFSENSSPILRSCIVWDNAGGSFEVDWGTPGVSYSCLETEEVWPGEGNTNADPLFCGWGDKGEVWVDPSRPEPGDGSQENPFSDIRDAATGYSLALSTGSPCLGTGKGGADMGADTAACGGPSGTARIVHLAPGTYAAQDLDLVHKLSVLGAGEDTTVIEGTLFGLRTGSSVAQLRVTKGTRGGIVVSAGETPQITNCTISRNWCGYGYGGLSCFDDPTPTFTNCTISGNDGRGVYCSGGSPTLMNCTISGNTEGGVYCDVASPALTNCTISGNFATYGGGLFCSFASPTITNCTISGNSAEEGGGVYCLADSFPTITNCTISGNSAKKGGGVYCYEDSLPGFENSLPTLTNCILWGNAPVSFCGGLSFCLVDRDPLFARTGEWSDCGSPDDPQCVPYRWDPGTGDPVAWRRWAFDYHLRPGSPAIDAGTSQGAPTSDIEGHGRPCGAGVDIGAYEAGDCPLPTERFLRGEVDGDGKLEINDTIRLLNYLFLSGDEPTCLDAADADDSGSLTITDGIYSLNYQFLGGPAPKSPFPDCGIDPFIDALDCRSHPQCP